VTERDIQNSILAAHSRGPTRLLRVNAGNAWQGRVIEQTPGRLILSPWYPIKLAATGVSDLIGWTTEEIDIFQIPGPSDGLRRVAVFTAIEVKDKGWPTKEQRAFIEMVKRSGGRAGVARSVEEAGHIIADTSEK
jgi:hypothetical protein